MGVIFHSLRLLPLALLLAVVACQRGIYPAPSGDIYTTIPAAAIPDRLNKNPVNTRVIPARDVPPNYATKLVAPSPRQVLYRPLARRLPRPMRPAAVVPRLGLPATHRPAVMNENTKFTLLFLGGGLLLIALGLTLAIGLGGWLAIVGGAMLGVGGFWLIALWLFAIGFKGGR
jgi:hypothetical protein